MSKGNQIGLSIILLIIAIAVFFPDLSKEEKKREIKIGEYIYTQPWRNTTSYEFKTINKILIKNKVGGCGEYYVKSTEMKDEYVVACSYDGKHWSYYVLYLDSQEVYPAHNRLGVGLQANPPR